MEFMNCMTSVFCRRDYVVQERICGFSCANHGISQSISSGIHWIFSGLIGYTIGWSKPPWSLVRLACTIVYWFVAVVGALLVQGASGHVCTSCWSTGYWCSLAWACRTCQSWFCCLNRRLVVFHLLYWNKWLVEAHRLVWRPMLTSPHLCELLHCFIWLWKFCC